MPIFTSPEAPISLPIRSTIWDWIFDEKSGRLATLYGSEPAAGFADGVTKERVDYNDVRWYATYISTALQKNYGFEEGMCLSLFSRNTIWYPIVLFAGTRVGGMVSGASPAYNVDEMTYALKTAGSKFLATSPSSINVAAQAAANVGIPQKHIFLLEGSLPGYTTVQDLIDQGRSHSSHNQSPAWTIPPGKTNHDFCAILSFSSGTTGLPKAVMISHQNVIAQGLQIIPITPVSYRRTLAVLPLFHITGVVHIMHLAPARNAEVIMLPEFSMPGLLGAVQEYGIEELLLVPPIIIRLVRDPVVDGYDLSSVRRFSSGAAPLSDEILQLLRKKFPGTGFKQGYGMTETCSCVTAHPPRLYDFKHAHTVGVVVGSTEVKILKEDGGEAGVGEPGEILARGPQVVMGYLNNSKATGELIDDEGFLHTGDQGVMDSQGLLTITDRLKEMVKVKGIGVGPAELEDLLLGHPDVEDVAVMGIPDEYAGQRPKAFVVVKDRLQGKEDEGLGRRLLGYIEEKKVRYKWAREVEFRKEIPKSASGKILRRVLRDQQKTGSQGLVVRAAERAKL